MDAAGVTVINAPSSKREKGDMTDRFSRGALNGFFKSAIFIYFNQMRGGKKVIDWIFVCINRLNEQTLFVFMTVKTE